MLIKVLLTNHEQGEILPLSPAGAHGAGLIFRSPSAPYGLFLPAGAMLCLEATPLFQVIGHLWAPQAIKHASQTAYPIHCPLLRTLEPIGDIHGETAAELSTSRKGFSLAVITLSDKGAQGLRQDGSGRLLAEMAAKTLPLCFCQNFLLADDAGRLRALLLDLALALNYDIILTTGGTGLSERDITPQTTSSVLDVPLPGFSQAMLAHSLEKTPNAILSRGVAGLIGKSLVINLPGSMRGAGENLEAILPGLPHALAKIHGDTTDCGERNE